MVAFEALKSMQLQYQFQRIKFYAGLLWMSYFQATLWASTKFPPDYRGRLL